MSYLSNIRPYTLWIIILKVNYPNYSSSGNHVSIVLSKIALVNSYLSKKVENLEVQVVNLI